MHVSVGVGPIRFYNVWALVLWVVGAVLRGAVLLVVAAVCRPRLTFALFGLSAVVWALLAHPVPLLLGAVLLLEMGATWALLFPASWGRRARPVLLARWRAVWLYRRKWRTAMRVGGLTRDGDSGRVEVPRLGRVTCTGRTDLVRVRGLLGQRFSEYETAAPMLAHVFGATGFLVHRGDDRRLTLELVRGQVGRSWNRDGYVHGADLERGDVPGCEPVGPPLHELGGGAVPGGGQVSGDRGQGPRLTRAEPRRQRRVALDVPDEPPLTGPR